MKGFLVGNGVTNWHYDCANAFIEMSYWHSLIDTTLYNELKTNECVFDGPYFDNVTPECLSLYYEFDDLVSRLDVYDIFGTCYGYYPHPQL